MDVIEIIMGIIAFCFFAFFGYWLVRGAKKNNPPESIRETGRELINGIMGGAVVAIIVITSEILKGKDNYPFFTIPLAIGSLIFMVGLAFWLGGLNKK